MIGFIRGKLFSKTPPQLVVDVQGVGYEVEAPMTTFYDLPALGEDVQLFTHLVIRDDAHILFAFSTLPKSLVRQNHIFVQKGLKSDFLLSLLLILGYAIGIRF